MTGTVAIVGAGGRNAQAWAAAFAKAGYRLRRLARTHPPGLDGNAVETRFIDLDAPASHRPALDGSDVLALVTPAHPRQVEREDMLIAAARDTGVGRIVKLSVLGADLPTPISAFARWQTPIEAALRSCGVPHVVLRANFFMQNLLQQAGTIAAGTVVEPAPHAPVSLIDVRDIADVAVACATGRFDGTALDLTGPAALDGAAIATALSAATGRSVRCVSPDLADFRLGLIERGAPQWHVAALVELYDAILAGHAPHLAVVSPMVRRITGRSPRPFLQFARDVFGPAMEQPS